MSDRDKNFVDPEDDVEEAALSFDTEDDEPPPKDEN